MEQKKNLLYKIVNSMKLNKKYTIIEIIELIDTDCHGLYINFALKKGIKLGIIKKVDDNFFRLAFSPTVITDKTCNK